LGFWKYRKVTEKSEKIEGELAWCRKEERKEETCPRGFTRCSPTLGGHKKKEFGIETNGIPGQCFDTRKAQDGRTYDCLDRTDENPFPEARDSKIDFSRLKGCTTYDGTPGLECGNEDSSNCIAMGSWCNDWSSEECPVLGAGIRTNNWKVCQEYRFWQNKPCRDEDTIRCRGGYNGQCVNKRD